MKTEEGEDDMPTEPNLDEQKKCLEVGKLQAEVDEIRARTRGPSATVARWSGIVGLMVTTVGLFTTVVQREQVKTTQSGLSSLGLYESSIDGILGPGTRQAIEVFQQKFNLEPTGTMTPEFVEILRRVTRTRN